MVIVNPEFISLAKKTGQPDKSFPWARHQFVNSEPQVIYLYVTYTIIFNSLSQSIGPADQPGQTLWDDEWIVHINAHLDTNLVF